MNLVKPTYQEFKSLHFCCMFDSLNVFNGQTNLFKSIKQSRYLSIMAFCVLYCQTYQHIDEQYEHYNEEQDPQDSGGYSKRNPLWVLSDDYIIHLSLVRQRKKRVVISSPETIA